MNLYYRGPISISLEGVNISLGKHGKVVACKGSSSSWPNSESLKYVVYRDRNVKPKDQKGAFLLASDCTEEEARLIAILYTISYIGEKL